MHDERYEIIKRVGEGGQGAVYLGYDRQLKREVAIKRLTQGEVGDDDARLHKEATLLASLRHPNVVAVFDVSRDDEGLFMVMERLQGGTLNELCRQGPRPGAVTFGQVAEGLLDALVAAHAGNILHRDIKPDNVHISAGVSGRLHARLLDFGLARASSAALKQTLDGKGNVIGTVHYMAPEQFRRRPLDARTDLYMLGTTFYEYLSGVRAFDADTPAGIMDRHLNHDFGPLQALRPDLPPALCDWVHWLMNREPQDRPSSAAEALAALRQVLAGGALVRPAIPVVLERDASPAKAPAPVAPPPGTRPATAAQAPRQVSAPGPRAAAFRPVAVSPTKKPLPWAAIITSGVVFLVGVFFAFSSARTQAASSPLPVADGLLLHLDSSREDTVELAGDRRIQRWADASGGALHASPPAPENAPRLAPRALASRSVMDSGPQGSGQWLEFQDETGKPAPLGNIRTVFWVMRGGGFLLGEANSHHFHRGYPETKPDGKIWTDKYIASGIRTGTLRLNGSAVDGRTTPLPEAFNLISLVTSSPVKAGRISSDRDLEARTGGQQIAELLIYQRPLTEPEEQAMEDYLRAKWELPGGRQHRNVHSMRGASPN